MQRLSGLDGKYQDQTAWVIGRGISLSRLAVSHVGPGPVIAVNQAITQVEILGLPNPLFSLQKDHVYVVPEKAILLVHTCESENEAVDFMLDENKSFSFDADRDYGLPWNTPSVAVAAAMAKNWGCSKVIYLCCDAMTHGDTRAFGDPATYPDNYLLHGPIVQNAARIPVEWRRIG